MPLYYCAIFFAGYSRYQALPFPFCNAVMLPLRPLPLPMGGNGGNSDPDRAEILRAMHIGLLGRSN